MGVREGQFLMPIGQGLPKPCKQERKCDMLITTAHLLALKELADGEAAGHAERTLSEDDPQEHIYRMLDLQGFMLLEVPRSYRLTPAGQEAFACSKPCTKQRCFLHLTSSRTIGAFLAPMCLPHCKQHSKITAVSRLHASADSWVE